MKKITILFMFCFVQMITGQNIISNGDFESSWASTFPWNENTGAATIVSDDTGSGSTDVLNIPSGAYQFEQVIEVSPGVTYEIFVRYKWINATAAGTYSTPVIRRGLTGTTGISLSGGPIIFAGDAGPEVTKLNVWRTKGTATFTVPSGVFKARLYYNRGAAGANIRFDDIEIKVKPDITWTGGASDGDLANTANWDGGVNPTATDVVLIPSGLTSYPTTGNITADEIFVNHGATFITTGTVTGGMHFYTKVEDTDWHLLSSVGTVQNPNNNWMAANGTASGSLSNKGIASYQNGTADGTTGNWVYNQVGHSGAMDAGKGYSMKRAVPGLYTFNGLYNQAPEAINITSDVNAWNLIANPFSSYMNIATFLSDNTTKLSGAYQSVYVWNASTSSYEDLTMGHIHPGQAFFVNSATASETVNITAAMESHQPGVTFYRNSNPSINLIASSSNLVKSTKIDYISGKTKGLDPRFDIGMFNGVSSELSLYTHLLEENSGIAFSKQVLPNQDFESMIIPVGVKVASGKEITFSANANNLPNGINVYLEDRQENTFTRLDEVNSEYKITLSENLDGVGRFYLHAKSSVLSKDNVLLESVNVFAPNNATLRILGLPNGNTNVKMFNVLGKQVLNNSFSAVTSKDISLPRLAKGVYIVQLQTENGSLNKKIILE